MVDKETLSLPNTPRSSFRQSVRKSLRKLKRKKKNNNASKNNETDSKYEVKVALRETDEDIYDTVELDDTVTDPEPATDKIEYAQEIVIKEYASRKPSFKSDKTTDENLNSLPCVNENILTGKLDIDTLIKDKESKLFPRGPLGDLLKQKTLKDETSNDPECLSDKDLENVNVKEIDEVDEIKVQEEVDSEEIKEDIKNENTLELDEEIHLPDSEKAFDTKG